MYRAVAVVAASLVLLPCQTYLAADSGEQEDVVTVASASALFSQFERLQAELQRHRALADTGGWPKVPEGPTIRPQSNDPRLELLARRLAASGDLAKDDISFSSSKYNETLQDAVRRFQIRHGLEVDGLVGRATLRALNVSIEQRIDQIHVNLERARRLPGGQSEDLVLVNIAVFEAYVVRDGETVRTTKLIVGDMEDETPEFRSELKYIVFNPTWSVPHSIASEEMLPKIKQDPGFFTKGGYQLYDGDGNRVNPAGVEWSLISVGSFPYKLVQQPGPENQLGQIKFMLPNEYSVCMHDTPAKSLFAKAARAFSHGCLRVEDPLAFAEVILGSEGWTREQINSQVGSGETRTVVLSEPLPVYVLYWTAEVDDKGTIHFYDDIYGRDAKVLRTLDRPLRSDHHVQPTDSG